MVLSYQQKRELRRKRYSPTRTAIVAQVSGQQACLTFMPENHTRSKWFISRSPYLAVGQLVRLTRENGTYVIEGPAAPGSTNDRRYLFNGGVFSPASATAKYMTQGNFDHLNIGKTIYATCHAESNSLFLVYLDKAVDVTSWNVARFRLRSTGRRSYIGVQRSPQVNASGTWLAHSNTGPSSVAEVTVNLSGVTGSVYFGVEQAGASGGSRGMVEIESICLTKT